MVEQEQQDELKMTRKTIQAARVKTTQQRQEIQTKREKLYECRSQLADVAGSVEHETELRRLQDEIDLLQKDIQQLQGKSHLQQEEINRLRRLTNGRGGDECQLRVEDTQTRAENIQTMQENIQRLREDLQRENEEWKKRERAVKQQTSPPLI